MLSPVGGGVSLSLIGWSKARWDEMGGRWIVVYNVRKWGVCVCGGGGGIWSKELWNNALGGKCGWEKTKSEIRMWGAGRSLLPVTYSLFIINSRNPCENSDGGFWQFCEWGGGNWPALPLILYDLLMLGSLVCISRHVSGSLLVEMTYETSESWAPGFNERVEGGVWEKGWFTGT